MKINNLHLNKTQLTPSTLVGLSIPLIGVPFWGFISRNFLRDMDHFVRALMGSLVTVGLAIGVILVVIVWEKKPWREMGLRRITVRSLNIALASSAVIAVGGTLLSLGIIKLFNLPMPTTMPEILNIFPIWFSIWIVVSGSIAEEILYRGFVIERIGQLTGNIWIGGGITLVWFTLLHLPLGWVYSLTIVFSGFIADYPALHLATRFVCHHYGAFCVQCAVDSVVIIAFAC